MSPLLTYLIVFLSGGAICTIGQILIIKTKITSARILVVFLLSGVVLEAFGVYSYLSDALQAGINVPIIGFGASLARGAIAGARSQGIAGAFVGGLGAVSGGIAAAIFFAFIFGIIFKAKTKKVGKN